MPARVAGVWGGERGDRSQWLGRVITDEELLTAMAVREPTASSFLHLPTPAGEITQPRVSIDAILRPVIDVRATAGRGRHVYSALAAVTGLAKRIWRRHGEHN